MATHLICDTCSASLQVAPRAQNAPAVLDFHERHGACGGSVHLTVSSLRKVRPPAISPRWT